MLLSPHHPCFTSQLELPTTSPPLFRALTLALPSLCFCFLLCLRLRLQARALLEPGSQEGSSEIVSDEDTQPSRQLVRLGRAIWRPRVVLLLLDGDLDRARDKIRVGSGQGRALHAPTPSESVARSASGRARCLAQGTRRGRARPRRSAPARWARSSPSHHLSRSRPPHHASESFGCRLPPRVHNATRQEAPGRPLGVPDERVARSRWASAKGRRAA